MVVTGSSTKSACFVSDLHLFSRRSTAPLYMDRIRSQAADAHTLVLGGDIFDFKWRTQAAFTESVDAAADWLKGMIELTDGGQVHFILGNHDSHPIFVERLEALQVAYPDFYWHRYYVRLGNCLFLHGDVADGALDHDALDQRRQKFEGTSRKHNFWHLAYELAIHAQLHRLALLTVREIKAIGRVRRYADLIDQGPDQGVTDVYFGHIHTVLNGVQFDGLRFHNGGAAIRGHQFQILEPTLSQGASIGCSR